MNKLVISGYYGFNNTGDELILFSIIRTLREVNPELEITVLSNQPGKTAKQFEVSSVSCWSPLGVLKAVAECDLFISGGGSLLQDVTSANSPLYYLGVLLLAKVLGKKTMVYSQGIGPLNKKRNQRLVAWLFNLVNEITVRDEGSKEDLLAFGVKKEIYVTADPVLAVSGENIDTNAGSAILERSGAKAEEGRRLLGVFIRAWGDNGFVPELVKACDKLSAKGWQVVFVPMHFPQDIAVAKDAAKLMEQESAYLKEMYAPLEMLSVTKNFDLIVGMRLHALIDAAVAGVPMVGLSYDPKVDRFLEQMGQQSLNAVYNLKAETLVDLIECVYSDRENIKKEISSRVKQLYQKAWQTARLAEALLKR